MTRGMTRDDVLEVLGVTAWDAPVEPDQSARAVEALETGRVLFFPFLPFAVMAGEQKFLSEDALEPGRKNISFDPAEGTCQGSRHGGAEAAELAAMLERFARQAEALMLALAPGYAGRLERARTSFRPAEIEDRATSVRKNDRLLHVDAFPTRPTRGKRILRVFSNIAPDGAERLWRVGEPFAEFAKKFFPRAGRG
ncbi:MAG: Kdo hydroxylase family protein, partial [Acetobacteraceae bacterium]